MPPLTANKTTPTQDAHSVGLESAGVIEIDNEYSELTVATAHLY